MIREFNLLIKTRKVTYDFTVSHKLNVVVGDSCAGKSFTFESLHDVDLVTSGNCNYIADSSYLSAVGTYNGPTLFLINVEDDSVPFSKIEKYILTCEDPAVKFLLFGRNPIRRLPISIANVFELETVQHVTKLRQKYRVQDLYNIHTFSTLVTEDSESGLHFWRQVIANTFSLMGAANILKGSYLSSDACYLLDGLGFGGYAEEFLERIVPKVNPSYFIHPSHEDMLCRLLQQPVKSLTDDINEEVAMTHYLNQITSGKYSKSNWCGGSACTLCKNDCKLLNLESILTKTPYNTLLQNNVPTLSEDCISKLTSRYTDFSQYQDVVKELKKTAETIECTLEEAIGYMSDTN